YLVARLYEPQGGRVEIDGVDIRDMTLASLAATVGLVSQETYLFHASIRENLRFACPEATDEQIEDAARAAQIHDLISSLPDGYDTPVGERGYRFSGGEKQRMAIARTVLRNPPVLILDEATSALDTETERAVQRALDDLSRGRTTIAIAHRLSTIRDADQILVLDAGQIVERGTHEELLELGGRYAALLADRRSRRSPIDGASVGEDDPATDAPAALAGSRPRSVRRQTTDGRDRPRRGLRRSSWEPRSVPALASSQTASSAAPFPGHRRPRADGRGRRASDGGPSRPSRANQGEPDRGRRLPRSPPPHLLADLSRDDPNLGSHQSRPDRTRA